MSQRFRTKRREPNDFESVPIYPAPDAGEGRTLKTLVDTPENYGQQGEVLIVNADRTGLEWGSASGVDTFLELTDTPSSFGTDGQMVVVNPTTDALIFVDPPVSFPEAPQDGTIYGRQDGTWVAVPSGGIGDAPSDGSIYGRQDGSWVIVPDPGISDAPQDGDIYARQNGTWISFDPFPEAPSNNNHYARRNGTWISFEPFIDAPSNGTYYARRNGVWSGFTPLGEAPQDGTPYARQDGGWVSVPDPGISDAPSDGTLYGRQDGAWVAVPPDTDEWLDDKLAAGDVTINRRSRTYTLQLSNYATEVYDGSNTLVADIRLDPLGEALVSADSALLLESQGSFFMRSTLGVEFQTGLGSLLYRMPISSPSTGQVLTAGATATQLEWATPASGGIGDAPSDGTRYVRRNGAWVADPLQTDAPSNGNLYARQNGSWVVVPPDEWLDDKLAAGDVTINHRTRDLNFELDRFTVGTFFSTTQNGEFSMDPFGRIDLIGAGIVNIESTATSIYLDYTTALVARKSGVTQWTFPIDQPAAGQIMAAGTATPTDLEWIDPPSGGGLTDAPSDGTLYGRQDGSWVAVPPDTDEWLDDKLAAGSVNINRTNRQLTLSLSRFLTTSVLGGQIDVSGSVDISTSGNNTIEVKAGGSIELETGLAANIIVREGSSIRYILPNDAPSAGQVLTAGATPQFLEWATPSGSGDTISLAGFSKSQVLLSRVRLSTSAPSAGTFNANVSSGTWSSFNKLHFDKRDGTGDGGWNGGVDWDNIPADVLIQILDNQTGRVYLYRGTSITANVSTSKRWAVTYLGFQGSTSGAPLDNTFCIVTFLYD